MEYPFDGYATHYLGDLVGYDIQLPSESLEVLTPILYAIVLTLVVSSVSVVGDFCVRKAVDAESPITYLLLGALVYGCNTIGWYYLMLEVKLAVLGALFAIFSTLMLIAIGVFFFKEPLSVQEMIGILLGMIALMLLVR